MEFSPHNVAVCVCVCGGGGGGGGGGGRGGEERRLGEGCKVISDANVHRECNILTSSLGMNLTLMSAHCPGRRIPVEGSTSK